MNHDQRFTPAEREALNAWTAETPPDDFTARVLARVALRAGHDLPAANLARPNRATPTGRCTSGQPTASAQGTLRVLAAAAAFALVLGCLWSWRGGGTRGTDEPGPSPPVQRALWGVPNGNDHDAGPRPEAAEVRPSDDGDQAAAS
jgi:ferric-dicitrate binding protein FerR (iron transport regulator)